jgi:hypothetical protein
MTMHTHTGRTSRPFRLLRWLAAVVAAAALLTQPWPASAEEPQPSQYQVGQYLDIGYVPDGGTAASTPPPGLTVNSDGRLVGIPGEAGQHILFFDGPYVCSEMVCETYTDVLKLLIGPGTGALGSFAVTAGNSQSTVANTPFATPLSATLTDARSVAAADTETTFTVTDGSATFPGGSSTATVRTDADGSATAPALTAGGTAGPVVVTVSQPGANSAAFMLTVTAPGPARADLVASVGAPSSVAAGASFPVTVNTKNIGPAPAKEAVSSILVPSSVTIVSAPGARRHGQLLVWPAQDLANGSTADHRVTLKAGPSKKTVLLSSLVLSATADPKPLNNLVATAVKIS